MANGFRGFARMLSTARNSSGKEGFRRMFSSAAEESIKIPKDAAPVELTAAERIKRISRDVDWSMMKSIATGLAAGLVICQVFFAPLLKKDTLGADKDNEPIVIRVHGLNSKH
ncbi:hypothetical protein MKW94_005207 [Papaver nudicaule]|uniref:Uncharacterized protein n=1 Tax=Papaver nudicaule TaxID=74823 RepID=A0AA41SJ75_PAPNU|nr:hypothetical protein [Papaver nudicaule]MCL7051516.1 hypothetical protein [Papaver nudicaule]